MLPTIQESKFVWNPERDLLLCNERDKKTPFGTISVMLSWLAGYPVSRNGAIGRWHRINPKMPRIIRPIFELPGSDACIYPTGNPGEVGFGFCGAFAAKPPFCNAHRVACYLKPRNADDALAA